MRILIYRLGSLGDTVVALPCFRLIRSHYPEAEIVVLTNIPVSGKAAAIEAVLEGTGLIDRYIPYPLGLRDPGKLAELRRRIAAEKFDRVISLTAPRGFRRQRAGLSFLSRLRYPENHRTTVAALRSRAGAGRCGPGRKRSGPAATAARAGMVPNRKTVAISA